MAARRTGTRDLDKAVDVLGSHKDEWASMPVDRRIALLRECLAGSERTAAEVVAAGCTAKGIDPRSSISGEEWMSGPIGVIRQIRLFIETLTEVGRTGYPALSDRSGHRTATGELAVTVFPRGVAERVMYPGTRIDVWMQPQVDESGLRETMAPTYRGERRARGAVTAVLGAGNVASIAPTDVLYKLLVEHQVVVLKMHPVNDYLGPLVERAFHPLVEAGYLRIVYGDAEEGQHLIRHRGVDEIHMTGSTAVHDRIVWGDTPEEQARRRAAGAPRVVKRVTSELGCVTPAIVVPGRWSDAVWNPERCGARESGVACAIRRRRRSRRRVAAVRDVAVNHWSAVSFVLGIAPWGAYPGHTLDGVGSGVGVVHNTLMFERPLKTVLWGPFTARPKPAWFTTHRRAHLVGRRMASFEASPSLWRLPAIAAHALRPGPLSA